VRQRQDQPVDDPVVEDEADDGPDEQSAEADEHPLAQLFEVLDERRLLAVAQAAR
jgi:hypothetical protein